MEPHPTFLPGVLEAAMIEVSTPALCHPSTVFLCPPKEVQRPLETFQARLLWLPPMSLSSAASLMSLSFPLSLSFPCGLLQSLSWLQWPHRDPKADGSGSLFPEHPEVCLQFPVFPQPSAPSCNSSLMPAFSVGWKPSEGSHMFVTKLAQ